MKPMLSTTSSSLICRIAQWWKAKRETDNGWAARHEKSCPHCQQYRAQVDALETALLEGAPSSSVEPPAGLEDRIWAAVEVDQSLPRARSTRTPFGRKGWAGLAAVAAVVLIVGVMQFSTQSSELIASETPPEFSADDMQALVAQVEDITSQWLVRADVDQRPEAKGSLDRELRALESDATAALRFLQLSFLPRKSAS